MPKSTNQDSHFSTAHLSADLKGRAIRGGAVTFVGQGAKFILQLGSTMVLARLLTPEDFGLIAMVAAVTGFILVFKDLGLSTATVQKADINHNQISTLFWINIAVSFALMLLTMALAPSIAWFYKEPSLAWVTVAMSTAFIFGGLTVQHQALLRRQMRFFALAVIDISSLLAGNSMGIICSLVGLGYWSLVLMQLTTTITMATGVWIASGWRPGPPVRRSSLGGMLAFGGYLTGFGVVNYFARNLDRILLGRYWGAQTLGLYTKAYSLLLLPIGQITAPITAVAVPVLSRLQGEPEKFRNYYLKTIKLIAYISMPVVVAMAVLSTELVGLVLGEQWLDAAAIFKILAVAAVLQPVGGTTGWIYVSLGQTRRMFIWVCMAVPIIALFLLIGLQWGAMGVATGYAISSVILIYPNFSFALKHSTIRVGEVFLNIYRPFMLSIIMGSVMIIGRGYLNELGLSIIIAGSLVLGGITFMLFARTWSSAWTDIKDIFAMVKFIFPRYIKRI